MDTVTEGDSGQQTPPQAAIFRTVTDFPKYIQQLRGKAVKTGANLTIAN